MRRVRRTNSSDVLTPANSATPQSAHFFTISCSSSGSPSSLKVTRIGSTFAKFFIQPVCEYLCVNELQGRERKREKNLHKPWRRSLVNMFLKRPRVRTRTSSSRLRKNLGERLFIAILLWREWIGGSCKASTSTIPDIGRVNVEPPLSKIATRFEENAFVFLQILVISSYLDIT